MSEHRFRNYYAPPYKAAVDANVACLMSSFNILFGQPASGNKFLLHDLLREEWGYKGMIISDYNSVIEMIAHGFVGTAREAAKKAVLASLDIEMVSQAYISSLGDLVKSGEVPESQIDASVRRILYYKYAAGIFDDPYGNIRPEQAKMLHGCAEHRKVARDVAAASMVLLKNAPVKAWGTPVLPLDGSVLDKVKSIALIGPLGDEHAIIGGWSAVGNAAESITLKDALRAKLTEINARRNTPITMVVEKGCDIELENRSGFDAAIKAAVESDVIILAFGEHQHMSGEARSRASLEIPGVQNELALVLAKLNKPMVLILFNGRPLLLNWYTERVDSILEAWFPGTEGGNAIVDILFGVVNPGGKLPVSFPYALGQVPVYYNYYSTGRPMLDPRKRGGYGSHFMDIPNEPLYPFGYGLSYTTFRYSDLNIDKSELYSGESLNVEVSITNTGQCLGSEVVQMYLQDVVADPVRPVKELKGFKKVIIRPGETKRVQFCLTPALIGYFTNEKTFEVPPGEFNLWVGSSSMDGLFASFSIR
jgi:beta-glucosidase